MGALTGRGARAGSRCAYVGQPQKPSPPRTITFLGWLVAIMLSLSVAATDVEVKRAFRDAAPAASAWRRPGKETLRAWRQLVVAVKAGVEVCSGAVACVRWYDSRFRAQIFLASEERKLRETGRSGTMGRGLLWMERHRCADAKRAAGVPCGRARPVGPTSGADSGAESGLTDPARAV